MDKVTVYQFRSYDIRDDEKKLSRRWGTREAIQDVCGEVIESTAVEVDAKDINSDITGLTAIGYKPNPPQGFQSGKVGRASPR